MNTNTSKYIFYVETIEGISFKVLFNIIEKNFPESSIVHFKVNKNGIFIFMEKDNIIIDSSFYGKYMNEFVFNGEEEFLFGIFLSDLIEIKKIKKKDILSLSVESHSRNINIKISSICSCCETSEHIEMYNKPILGIQNYINEIPQGYCDFPINLNNSKLLHSLWKKKSKDDGVNIQLMKNTIKLSFHDTNSIILGENVEDEILYEDTFKKELITNIIKISSFGTLRIYYGKDLPLLFSAMVGCGSGNINLYVSARSETSPDYF